MGKRSQIKTWVITGLITFSVLEAFAQDTDNLRTISVVGEGVVHVNPDMATVRFGIVSRASLPEEARRYNAEAARDAMNAVRELGVDENKILLETLQLQPARAYNQETRRYEEVGFDATRQVVVELNDLEILPALITRVVQQGANRLNGVVYDVQDRDDVRDEALRNAVLDARSKARLMAETLEAKLGKVVSVSEQSTDFPRPTMRMALQEAVMSKDAAEPVPEAFAAGEIEMRASVHVVFELE